MKLPNFIFHALNPQMRFLTFKKRAKSRLWPRKSRYIKKYARYGSKNVTTALKLLNADFQKKKFLKLGNFKNFYLGSKIGHIFGFCENSALNMRCLEGIRGLKNRWETTLGCLFPSLHNICRYLKKNFSIFFWSKTLKKMV